MIVISVVRDQKMYDKCIRRNTFLSGSSCVCLDNTQDNQTIPARYNCFLDHYNYTKPEWFVFCHEDWEVKEDLLARLASLDRGCLYGPIGMALPKSVPGELRGVGEIVCSDKDGSKQKTVGVFQTTLREVGTFDCQCLIVHSSLIQKYHLRFDENLSFDLYVEDFCMMAREKYHIVSKILQLKCHHWSFGSAGERFLKQYCYIQNKYHNARQVYITTCNRSLIGGRFFDRILIYFSFYVIPFLFQKKQNSKGITSIKLFKIPVYRKRSKKEKQK